MARKKKARKQTNISRNLQREIYSQRQIDKAVEWSERTGVCVVCKTEPKAAGITCARPACVSEWLKGRAYIKAEIIVDELSIIEE